MTKAQFLGLKRQGFTLQFVSYGEDLTAKIDKYCVDATYTVDKYASTSKSIKVKLVEFGAATVTLREEKYCGDFKARC